MPRNIFKKWMPDPKKIRDLPGLGVIRHLLDDPNLFHLNRHSVSVAFFVGLFACFLPVPGQIPLAAIAALLLRCNLPITILLVWVSNPLTIPFIFYGAYRFGAYLLERPPGDFAMELSWEWLQSGFQAVWEPLLLGSFLFSLFFSCAGYLAIQWIWRWQVMSRWRERQTNRKQSIK